MECLNCGIEVDLEESTQGLCMECFKRIICDDASKDNCEFEECEFFDVCQL
jgi:NMD protein affecting ribosome stability and mRNA decay